MQSKAWQVVSAFREGVRRTRDLEYMGYGEAGAEDNFQMVDSGATASLGKRVESTGRQGLPHAS